MTVLGCNHKVSDPARRSPRRSGLRVEGVLIPGGHPPTDPDVALRILRLDADLMGVDDAVVTDIERRSAQQF